ncbi:MAG: LysE family translocator [Gammaproteobacteria bacterium]|nr:LysE family translocator [Gammaproteobacteria bacterium]
MEWHHWLAFAAASALMGLAPGPGVTSIVGYALSSGRRTALASVAGMMVGNVTAMSLSLAGVGALLSASALAFTLLKWIGAAYLIGLGLFALLRSRGGERLAVVAPTIAPRTAFASNVALGTFHPKTIVFFVAFVPQFIDPRHGYLPQAALLIATFGIVVGLTDSAYALAAASASRVLRTPAAAAWMKRAGAGAMIAAGTATALTRG